MCRAAPDVGDFDGADAGLAAAYDVFTARDLHLESGVTLMVWSEVHLHLRNDQAAAEATLQQSVQLFTRSSMTGALRTPRSG